MPRAATIDQRDFRRILTRNIVLPLAAGIVSAGVFVAVFAYLLGALNSVENTERVIGNVQALRRLTVDMETGMRGFLLSGDEAFLAPYRAARPQIGTAIDVLAVQLADEPAQAARLNTARAQHRQWLSKAEEMLAARRAQGDYLAMVKAGHGKAEFDELREQFAALLGHEEQVRDARSATARSVSFWTVTVFLVLSLIISGLLAWFGRRDLLRLSRTYTVALDEQTAHSQQLQSQAWLRKGQSELAGQTIGQMALPQLSENLLQFLAQRLDAAVAAFYVQHADGSLERTAAYGFSQADMQQGRRLAPGEGLPGQAVRGRQTLHLQQLPAGYIKVSSALGDGAPQEVVLQPLRNDGQINGLVELGFLHPVGARELEFLGLVADNIGMAIAATQSRQRLARALEETQSLNEELQVQQEELRTANEELEEQSRVLERSQASLETQKVELEQSNARLAEQAGMLDQRNMALAAVRAELEARAHELERASAYKSQFLATMSHELRTPLNSSLILAKLLAENEPGNLNEEQVRFADTIYRAGNDLLALINDILDMSKVEAGKLELAPEDVALAGLLEDLTRVFAPLAQDKQLSFRTELAPGLPPALHTDRQRLEQVLKNLLSNAIKFTDSGEVVLRVSPGAEAGVQFAVHDTGVGIRPELQQAVFEPFQQGDGGASRRYAGTGLGLAISRDLARLLGGGIALESTVGSGSTFTLTLPLQWRAPAAVPVPPPVSVAPMAAAASPATPPAPAAPRPFEDDRARPAPPERMVLVIEDDPAFARILYELAHELSYRALVAFTAEEGLQLAVERQPAAILLDLRLPDRSGLSLLQLLKDNPDTRHIPVHVVSAAEQSEAALHMGAIGFALKPASRDQLREVFRRLEQRFTQTVKRILLVEDDARQRDAMVSLIGDDDIAITAVASGGEALAQLRSTIFDCMIVDLKLPDMQGGELLQQMSQGEIASFPPVIVYTGRNLTRSEEAELSRYSRSIIIKGARSPERLLDEVTLFLHKVESTLSSERQTMLKAVRSRDRMLEGRRILLVDDDVRNIFALSSALEMKGATVDVARNGEEALDKLEMVPDIDVVLMDVMMPGMDGLEATRRIRANPRLARMPVIAVTAKAMKDDQEQCLAAGANDYLAKPIDLSRLYSLLRVWMPAVERI